jgi:hypothetical protein
MKKALISTIEPRELGYRVAQVEDLNNIFEVANDLFWVDCADDVIADQFWYDPNTQKIEPMPISIPTILQNRKRCIDVLKELEWAFLPVMADPNISNPYLANQQEFINYKNIIQTFLDNPKEGNLDWPTMPEPIWQKK